MKTPASLYQHEVSQGRLVADSSQQNALNVLGGLHQTLTSALPKLVEEGGLRRWQWPREEIPKGIFLFGPVGRGKSMLMQLFFEALPFSEKKRVHFHAFMEDIHQKLHEIDATKGDPVAQIASQLAQEAKALCFDEYYITNIADAMMLGRLFKALEQSGVVVLATSNWAPDDLFQGGVNRHNFMPFIRDMKERFQVVSVAGEVDHRQAPVTAGAGQLWCGENNSKLLINYINSKFKCVENKGKNVILYKEKIATKTQGEGVVVFEFDALCRAHLGREHYLELASKFPNVGVVNVPKFKAEEGDVPLRFITLVDILYEQNTQLFLHTLAPPAELYPEGPAAFAFQRTASRLAEMLSVAKVAVPAL